MRFLRAVILCALVAVLPTQVAAAERQLPGRVVRVVDGDSLVLDVRGSHHRVDLAGIDAPELNQPWGTTAAAQLGRLLTGAFVVVEGLRDTRDGNPAGAITFMGRDVAYDLLYDGLAWSTIPLDTMRATDLPGHPYTAAETAARAAAG